MDELFDSDFSQQRYSRVAGCEETGIQISSWQSISMKFFQWDFMDHLREWRCVELNSMMSKFWWGEGWWKEKSLDNRISWSKLCRTKRFGGMSFCNLHNFNLALPAKPCYFPSISFLNVGLPFNECMENYFGCQEDSYHGVRCRGWSSNKNLEGHLGSKV